MRDMRCKGKFGVWGFNIRSEGKRGDILGKGSFKVFSKGKVCV